MCNVHCAYIKVLMTSWTLDILVSERSRSCTQHCTVLLHNTQQHTELVFGALTSSHSYSDSCDYNSFEIVDWYRSLVYHPYTDSDQLNNSKCCSYLLSTVIHS